MNFKHLLLCGSIVSCASIVHASLPFECPKGDYYVPAWEEKEEWSEGIKKNTAFLKIKPCENLEIKEGSLVVQGKEPDQWFKIGGRWINGFSRKNIPTPYNQFNVQSSFHIPDQTFFLEYADRTGYIPTRSIQMCLQLAPSDQEKHELTQSLVLPNGAVWDLKAVVEPLVKENVWKLNFYAKSPREPLWDQDIVCLEENKIGFQENHRDHSVMLPMAFYPEGEDHQAWHFPIKETYLSYHCSILFEDYKKWEFKESIPLTISYAQHGIEKFSGKLVCDGVGPMASLKYETPYVIAKRTNGMEERIFEVLGACQK